MPFFLHKQLDPSSELGLWQIVEDEPFFLEKLALSDSESGQLNAIRGRKRIEWLAARYLVHLMSGRSRRAEFLKDEFGKPFLRDTKHHISISHSHGMAAAIASPLINGIDIQYLIPRIERIAKKFCNQVELDSIEEAQKIPHLHIFWGAKEALYKAYGRKELDFCKHLLIQPFEYQFPKGTTLGRIQKEDYIKDFVIQYEQIDNYMLVYVMEKLDGTK